MDVPVVPPNSNIQFTTIGKQPSLLSRMSGFSVPLGPVVDDEDVSAAPSSPPGSPSPQTRTTSLGRLASLLNTDELGSSLPEIAASAAVPTPQTGTIAGSSTSSIFNLPAEIFKTASKPPVASIPSVPTSFYFRPVVNASSAIAPAAGPSTAPAPVSHSQATPVTTATPTKLSVSLPERIPIDAPSRPPEPATPLHASTSAASPASVPGASSRLAAALRDSRIELDDLRRTRARVRDEFQEFRHRWQETEHALARQKAQMERLVAVCEEWFDEEERVHGRRELRLEEEERMREAERAEAEERARVQAEEAQRREEERVFAEEQAFAEAEAQRRREEEKREIEARQAAERRRIEEETKAREEDEEKQRKAAFAEAEAQEQARRALEEKQRKEDEERARREAEEHKKQEEVEARAKAARENQERLEAEKYKAEEAARMKLAEEEVQRETARAMAERAQFTTLSPGPSYQAASSFVEPASPSPEVLAAVSIVAPQEAVSRAFSSPSVQRVSPYNPDAPQMTPGGLLYPQDEIRTQANAAPFFEVRQSVLHNNPAPAASPSAMAGSVSAAAGGNSGPVDAPRISADMQDRLTVTLAANSAPSPGSSHLPSSAAAPQSSGRPAPAGAPPVAQKPPSRGTPRIVRNRFTSSSVGSLEERKLVLPPQDMPPPRASPAQSSAFEQAPMSSQAPSAPTSTKSGKKKKKNTVNVKPEPSPSPTTESAPTLPQPAARDSASRPPAVVHALPPKPSVPNPQVRKGQALSKPREQTRTNVNGDRLVVRPPTLDARNSPVAHSAPVAPELPGDRFVAADQHIVPPPAHARVEPLADRRNYVPMHGGFDDDGMVVSARDDSPHRAYTPPRAFSPPEPRERGDYFSPSPVRASRSRDRRYSPSPARSPQRAYTPPPSPYREPLSPNRKRFRDDDRDLPPARRPRYDDRPPPPPHLRREPTPPLPPPARPYGDSYRPGPREMRRISPPPSYSAVMSSRIPQDPPPRAEPRPGGQPRRAGPSNIARHESAYVPAMPPPPVAPLSARIGNPAPLQERAPVPRQDHVDLMSRLSDPRPQLRNAGPRAKPGRAPADEPPPRRGRPSNPVQPPRKGRGGAAHQEPRSGKGPLESRLS